MKSVWPSDELGNKNCCYFSFWSKVTTDAECVPEWTNFTDQFVLGGTLYAEFSTSAENCQRGCADLATDCIAANVFHTDNGSILCFLHSDRNDLTNKFDSRQANLYQLLRPCPVRTAGRPTETETESDAKITLIYDSLSLYAWGYLL